MTGKALSDQGFEYQRIDTGEVGVNVAVAGSGPPLLLLHGYPQTHVMWRLVTPRLIPHHTVVLTDLRGYGDSGKPDPGPDDQAYAKRAMARDQVEVMHRLGFEQFDLVGHDRGARVAQRLVLDRPEVVRRLAVLDIVPTRHVLGHVDRGLAEAYWHWFFLAAGGGIPERLVGADPEYWVRSTLDRLTGPGVCLEEEAVAEYVRSYLDPRTVRAGGADYRAGASVDLVHDDESVRQGRRIEVPTLALWGEHSYVGRAYDPLAVWREYATDVRGQALDAGHFVAEERPDEVGARLRDFLA